MVKSWSNNTRWFILQTQMIHLYNTMTRKKEAFEPLSPPLVTMYNCGPTVYNYAHVGNLRGYVNADILARLLRHKGYEVRQVINITDVGHLVSDGDDGEDKIEEGARREKRSVEEIIEFYTKAFKDDLVSLGIDISKIYKFPRATEHIKEQIDMISALEEKGYVYVISDGVYFDTARFPEYGALARLDIEHLREGARVEANPEKRNPTDFALWKFSLDEDRLQEWDSPWGVGFPGWHIECSAMSIKYLGETLDIHTGGIDHIPIHHTNEIAQSVCATGKQFARYWLHHEFVNTSGAKMAKSAGNFIRLETLLDRGYSALDYRYLLLQAHYRTPLTFSFEALDASKTARGKLIRAYKELKDIEGGAEVHKGYKDAFEAALEDDINTAEALALVWSMLKDEGVTRAEKRETLSFFDSLLGLGLEEGFGIETATNIPEDVRILAEQRQKEKEAKNYAKADEIRDEIRGHGFEIKDTKDGFELLSL